MQIQFIRLVKTKDADDRLLAEVVAGADDTEGRGLKLGSDDVPGTELSWRA